MRRAPEILLTDDELGTLERRARGRLTAYRVVLISRIVLMVAQGMQNKDIAVALGTTADVVDRWRKNVVFRWRDNYMIVGGRRYAVPLSFDVSHERRKHNESNRVSCLFCRGRVDRASPVP